MQFKLKINSRTYKFHRVNQFLVKFLLYNNHEDLLAIIDTNCVHPLLCCDGDF